MTLDQIILQLLTSLQLGAVFVLVALGLTLIFGTLGIANFAHGALYLIGAYVGLVISNSIGWPWALIIVPAILFLVGIIFDRVLLQFFYKRAVTDQILVTFGLALIVQETMRWIFGGTTQSFDVPRWARRRINLGDYIPGAESIYYPPSRLIMIGVAILAVIALYVLLRYTKFGLMVRAGMRDPEMVRYLGIDSTRLFTIVVGLGAMFAGLAAVINGPVFGIDPGEGMLRLVPAFLVVVIGGMGSISGAVVAGLLLGFATTLTTASPFPQYSEVVVYLIAVVVLSIRPRGLFGMKGVG